MWVSNSWGSDTWKTQERRSNEFEVSFGWAVCSTLAWEAVWDLSQKTKQANWLVWNPIKSQVLSNEWGMLVHALQPVLMCRVWQFPWCKYFQVLSEIGLSSQSSWKSSRQLLGSAVSWCELVWAGSSRALWASIPVRSWERWTNTARARMVTYHLGSMPSYWDVTVDIRQLHKGGIGMYSLTLKTRMIPIYQDVWQLFRAPCQQIIILLCL